MFKQTHKFFLVVACLFSIQIQCQNISVSSQTACLPTTTNFSASPSGATYNWDFGNGQGSNLQNPSVAYTSAQVYNVSCTITIGGTPTVKTLTVLAAAKPTVNFNMNQPASGCAVKTVTFTDQSTGGGGSPIVGWVWTYGDGSPFGVTANPVHAYSTMGSYTVTLKVTDANGCDNTTSIGTINVSNPPTAVINPANLGACSAPYTASFSSTGSTSGSPTGGGLTYSWNFPGGSPASSGAANPGNVTYNTTGSYNVTLTVTDNNNCSTTTVKNFAVNQPSITALIPSTICVNSNYTINANTNQSLVNWTFGNSTFTTTTANSTTVMNNYTAPGIYTVIASTIPAPGTTCSASQTKTVYVQQVVANFTATPPSFTCSPTFTAAYVNQSSSNAVSFTWTATNYNGGSVSTSTLTNPTFTLVQGSLNPYTIYQTFSSNVSLIAQSAFGCVSTMTMHIFDSIRRPTAWFNKDKKEGCAPLIVKFRDSSFTSATYPITSYTWNNGANPATIISGTAPPIPNQTFTYNTAGTYTPYLIVQTATGCIDTSFIDTVHVANPPNVNIAFSPSVACWNTPIQTTLSATPATTPAIQHWHVDSDNGFFSGCVNDPNPQWNFTHTGVHTFTVSGYLYSCKGTNTSTASVTIKGPIAQARFETNCTNRKSVNFYHHLQDAQGATLNFGDNSSVSLVGTPGGIATGNTAHTYSASGDYTAVLTATNAATGCAPYTYTMLVKVRDAIASFTMPAVACASVAQTFDATSSQDVLVGCQRGYVWYIDNNPPQDTTLPNYSYTFYTPGTHTVMLMVKDENSCADTTKKTFRVSSASPNFSFSANPICLSTGTVNIFNTTPQTPDPIIGYSWSFGDGTSSSSAASVINHAYTSAASPSQIYTVVLTATNSFGCSDSKTLTLTVSNPVSYITSSPGAPCLGTPVNFTGPSGAGNTYTFSFGASATSTLATSTNTAVFNYPSAGQYTAFITLKDANGCISSNSVALTVYSMTPADFTFSSPNATGTNNICSGSPVVYTCTTQSAFPLNYSWSNATINSSVVTGFIPSTTANSVVVTVTVSTNPIGCTSVVSKTINVYKASADLQLDKTTICLGNSINFNVKDSSTVYAWTWFFGDGDTLKAFTGAPPPTVVHTYTNYPQLGNGSTTVTLVYYSPQYACKYFVQQPITIIKLNPTFNRNNEIAKKDSVHCLNIPDLFTNSTPGSSGFVFSWNFGDGGTSSVQNPTYTYPLPGIYQVTLNVTDPVNNCVGYTVKNMTINAIPSVSILAPDSVCKGSQITLTGNGSPNIVSYTWSPASAVTSLSTSITTSTVSSNPATYSLGVTDANGCTNNTVTNIYVQQPSILSNWDTTVIIGQIIPLNGYAGSNFNYTWTPTTDLNCNACPYPTSTSTVDITYSLTAEDGLGCFKTTTTFSIHVDPRATVDVPTAFTPNGDGTNDFIFPDGWGIKKVNYFRVFNRWGQLLFETNQIKVGWDGTYNGIPQNMETYIYQVSVDTYVDKDALLKTGTFKLIR